jgi:hypothetical protein
MSPDPSYRDNWWIFGEPRRELRPALSRLTRYIATVDTAKFRLFQFIDSKTVCDDKVVIVASDDDHTLGVLSSSVHRIWVEVNQGGLGVTPVYVKSPEQRAIIAELAEELDATRKASLAEVPGLTMTEIYNLRAKLLSGDKLSFVDEDRARAARAGIVHRLHEQIDAAVADAYGWPADLSPAEIVMRLVALNAERTREESEGNIRWLRPDYQIPRFGAKKA